MVSTYRGGPCHARRFRSGGAFTLTELLVVISLLVLLGALAIPVGNRVRGRAMEMQCVSNLRQVGAALALYVGENKGKLPVRFMESGGELQPSLQDRYWNSRLIRRGYVSNPDVFYCPACFPTSDRDATRPIDTTGGQTYGMRIFSTADIPWNQRTLRDMPLSGIENKSDFFLVADSLWVNYTENNGKPTQGYSIAPGSSGENQRIHLRHSGHANALFADFHVERKNASYFVNEVLERQGAYSNNFPYSVYE